MIKEKGIEVSKKNKTETQVMRDQMRQSIFLIIITIVIIGIATLAWFINQTLVSGDGVNLSAQDSRFELKIEENYETSDSGSVVSHTETQTSSASDTVLLYKHSNFGIQNGHGVYPGTRGSITFYIEPKVEDLDKVICRVSLEAFQQGNESEYDVMYHDNISGEDWYLKKNQDSIIKELIQGHILLFEKQSEVNTNHYYSGRIEHGKDITVDLAQIKDSNGKYPVTLHWVWPLEFSNYVKTGDGGLFASENISEMEEMIVHMNRNKNLYFYPNPETQPEYDIKPYLNMGTEKFLFEDYYNKADQYIGKNINYLALDVDVRETN